MKTTLLAALVLGGITMSGAGIAAAGAMPAAALQNAASGDVVRVEAAQAKERSRDQRAQRQRVVTAPPPRAPYIDYNATYRGFEDPGFALRGNMPGCAIDLGYGRWETCD